jgi:hypothetical protein
MWETVPVLLYATMGPSVHPPLGKSGGGGGGRTRYLVGVEGLSGWVRKRTQGMDFRRRGL